jgi:two-component system, OmpR family, response regulator CpxR
MHASAPALRTHILMVDDDMKLCRLIRDFLAAHTGPQGVEMALRQPFAALILDVMMPGMDGLAMLRRIRKSSSVPVLMLTGRGEESDRIVGLELGADHYLSKTFSTPELLARLRGDTQVNGRAGRTNWTIAAANCG